MKMSAGEIGAIITALVALGGMILQWYKARGEGIGAVAEGYDHLLPHLNKRIKELLDQNEELTKRTDDQGKRIAALEKKDKERHGAIIAAISAIDNSINQLNDTKELLKSIL